MTDYYQTKYLKYKLKYFNLLNQSGGYTPEEKRKALELTKSTPEKAITILANITDVKYIQKIYNAMSNENINYNQIEIVLKIMQERKYELYLHQEQNKNLEIHEQKLKNIEIVQQFINSALTILQTRIRTHEHTESELVTAQNIIIQLSPILNEVREKIKKAKQKLDVLIKGEELYLVDFITKQGIIDYIIKIIEIQLKSAQILVNQGKEIVIKIEQKRQIQKSISEVGQKLSTKILNRNSSIVQLKTRN